MKLNEIVKFGNFYHSNSEEKTSIEWLVIDETEEYYLLISKMILSEMPFNKTPAPRSWTWNDSTIKAWLNTNFYNDAFSDTEKENISPLDDGSKVFIITCREATMLMTEEQRAAELTEYARSKGIWKDNCWWVASRGYSASDTIIVKANGYLNDDAYDRFSTNGCGVRPSIRLKKVNS